MVGMFDAVVVGGGPAGTITAGLLAKDHEVVVLEEHASSGRPMQCAGLVTQEVIDMCGAVPDILNRIKGADVIFPSGGRFEVRIDGTKALLIDRADLDRKLAEKAADKGAEIRYGVRYTGHTVSEDAVAVSTGSCGLSSKVIIGADGQNSKVAMSLGVNLPKEYVYGIEADVRHRSEYDDIMTMRLGSEFAPGFFSWEIPFGDMMRIGLCISPGRGGSPIEYLKKLLKTMGINNEDIVSKYAGKIPLGGRPRTFGDRTLLIGDAAGQVKPVSGGGLHPICRAAPILDKTVREALREGVLTSKRLSFYERDWKREFGGEMKKGYRIRKIFTGMSDADLDKVFEIIDRDDMRAILSEIDIDDPSGSAAPMLVRPQVGIRLLPLMVRALI